VAEQVRGVSHLFVVPDGALNLVSFAALPVNGNRYLVEDSSFLHYVSTERDLIGSSDVTPGRGLLAVGGAIFDERLPRTSLKPADGTSNRGTNGTAPLASAVSGSLDKWAGCGPLRFSALPGTKDEVLEIAGMWPVVGADEVAVLTDRSADERTVKGAVVGRQVVHLATHGFFLGSGCGPQMVGTRAVGGLAKASSRAMPATEENPLILAGLAFAGANRRSTSNPQQDDGILTAEEVAGLNLQGTQWAVLSACDTGLGAVRAGEGVFGLRRAFQIAGARTVIMSLWSVEDRATRDWMRALYDARLRRGLDTVESVREASRTILAERRAKRQSTHPFYWAAFVATGDWR
jgi:CHAT domain-containing protein